MSLKILLVDSEQKRARSLERTLSGAGFPEVSRVDAGADLVEAVRRIAPDLVIIDMALPDRDALEGVRALSSTAPRPIVMFSDKDDPAFVEDAIAAGVCSYNLSGVSDRDMKAIVASAVALFKRYARVETELAAANAQLEERRIVERAKALLMAARKVTEPQAYKWLRNKAMNENRRIAQVAADVIRENDADGLLK
ncbi:MAG TPA: ANTAR domain-containing protein [Roseiarcus sp.]|nr:ANTAR domain-containing protein [Roseiarcus sp.]